MGTPVFSDQGDEPTSFTLIGLFLEPWYHGGVIPASRCAQRGLQTCGNARGAIQKSMTPSTSAGPAELLPMASKTRVGQMVVEIHTAIHVIRR
jgi:hypothetical protein